MPRILFGFVFILLATRPSSADEPSIKTAADAVRFAMSEDRIPRGAHLRELRVISGPDGTSWQLDFLDGEVTHSLKLKPSGDFRVTKREKSQASKPGFWEAAPRPEEVAEQVPKVFEKARVLVTKAGAVPGAVSLVRYEAGDRDSQDFKAKWTVSISIKPSDKPESDSGSLPAKIVTFEDGRHAGTRDGTLIQFKTPL